MPHIPQSLRGSPAPAAQPAARPAGWRAFAGRLQDRLFGDDERVDAATGLTAREKFVMHLDDFMGNRDAVQQTQALGRHRMGDSFDQEASRLQVHQQVIGEDRGDGLGPRTVSVLGPDALSLFARMDAVGVDSRGLRDVLERQRSAHERASLPGGFNPTYSGPWEDVDPTPTLPEDAGEPYPAQAGAGGRWAGLSSLRRTERFGGPQRGWGPRYINGVRVE